MPKRFRPGSKGVKAQGASPEYLAAARALEEGIPADALAKRRDLRYLRKKEAKAKGRERHLLEGLRKNAKNPTGNVWGNTPYQRRRFLESKIEVSERLVRAKRMLRGRRQFGQPRLASLAGVRSAEWPCVAAWVAYLIGTYRLDTLMKSSPAGEADDIS